MTEQATTDGRVQVRVDPATARWLADRAGRMHTGSTHLQAKTELDLWRAVLSVELRRIRLTLAEASCLADILNASMLDATIVGGGVGIAYAEAYDAFRLARESPLPGESSYAAKWDIDEDRLLDVLSRLGPAGDHALRDAFSRWWANDHEPTSEGFAAVGLTVGGTTVAGRGAENAR
jgi:hypothetical protein